jgi:hypothetical protein
VFSVVPQLGSPVGKNEEGCLAGASPSDDPLPVRINNSCGFDSPDNKLDSSDFFRPLVIMCDRVSAREDVVEVDGAPREEVGPL